MQGLSLNSFTQNFLGHAPDWYKKTIVAFLVLNPFLLLIAGPYIAGWVLVLEFIFTLAMALKCYPLQPGGLLAFEGIVLGMTNPTTVLHEVEAAFPVILLLIFMVAGIYFMKITTLHLYENFAVGTLKNAHFVSVLSYFGGLVRILRCANGNCGGH